MNICYMLLNQKDEERMSVYRVSAYTLDKEMIFFGYCHISTISTISMDKIFLFHDTANVYVRSMESNEYNAFELNEKKRIHVPQYG